MQMDLTVASALSAFLIAVLFSGCSEHQQAAVPHTAPKTKMEIEARFLNATAFHDGLAAVQSDDGRWGYIDKTGSFVIPSQFEDAGFFCDGVAAVYVGGKDSGRWGFIDKQGKYLVNPQYTGVWGCFKDGYVNVNVDSYPNAKMTMINRNGQIVFQSPDLYGNVGIFSEELAPVSSYPSDAKHAHAGGFINREGKFVIGPKYQSVGEFSQGLAPASLAEGYGQKWGYINKGGTFVVQPQFDLALPFHDGYAQVGRGSGESLQIGYVDLRGNLKVPCQFSSASDFSEGLASVRIGSDKNGKDGYIDRDGRLVINPQYASSSSFNNGLAWVQSADKKVAFIDKTGRPAFKNTFDNVDASAVFDNGYMSVAIKVSGAEKWGLISRQGDFVLQPVFDEPLLFSEGMAVARLGSKYGYIKTP